ncbi:Hypothetical protein D9617_14g077060 [Elsinoe fawcettii]|nr:Hypothetical protein D9617_14g077060 [Elsinoe fawcettii]
MAPKKKRTATKPTRPATSSSSSQRARQQAPSNDATAISNAAHKSDLAIQNENVPNWVGREHIFQQRTRRQTRLAQAGTQAPPPVTIQTSSTNLKALHRIYDDPNAIVDIETMRRHMANLLGNGHQWTSCLTTFQDENERLKADYKNLKRQARADHGDDINDVMETIYAVQSTEPVTAGGQYRHGQDDGTAGFVISAHGHHGAVDTGAGQRAAERVSPGDANQYGPRALVEDEGVQEHGAQNGEDSEEEESPRRGDGDGRSELRGANSDDDDEDDNDGPPAGIATVQGDEQQDTNNESTRGDHGRGDSGDHHQQRQENAYDGGDEDEHSEADDYPNADAIDQPRNVSTTVNDEEVAIQLQAELDESTSTKLKNGATRSGIFPSGLRGAGPSTQTGSDSTPGRKRSRQDNDEGREDRGPKRNRAYNPSCIMVPPQRSLSAPPFSLSRNHDHPSSLTPTAPATHGPLRYTAMRTIGRSETKAWGPRKEVEQDDKTSVGVTGEAGEERDGYDQKRRKRRGLFDVRLSERCTAEARDAEEDASAGADEKEHGKESYRSRGKVVGWKYEPAGEGQAVGGAEGGDDGDGDEDKKKEEARGKGKDKTDVPTTEEEESDDQTADDGENADSGDGGNDGGVTLPFRSRDGGSGAV